MAQDLLGDVRILDLSRALAGPYAGRVLCDLGAEVIKVEPPEGDEARLIGPRHDRGMSALLTFANVGKRALCIDLRKPGAAEVLLDLAAGCDAVIENFRPGVLERLGLGWDVLHARSPRLVLLSLNGFGSDSVWANRRAYAPVVHAVSGLVEDQADNAGTEPVPFRENWADTLTGLHGTIALLSALRGAERSGEGERIEVPMFDALLTTGYEVLNSLLPLPDDRVRDPIYDAGPHGKIAATGTIQHVWASIARAHPELRDPCPPGADLPTKARLRREALEAWMAAQPSRETVLEKLAEARIGCAPVQGVREALTGELAKERDLLVEVDDRRGGTRSVVRPAARFSRSRHTVRGPAPLRGEHNRAVLREIAGYDDARIDGLEAAGILQADQA